MKQKGFTLIELMIAVAIIGVLAVIAIPQYQNYVARAQATEGFSLAGGLKTAVAEYHNTNGVFPDGTPNAHSAIGIEDFDAITGKYVTGVTVSNDGEGTITATFGSGIHEDKFLRLTPTETDGAVYFDCTTDIEEDWRPSGCEESTGTGGSDGTGGGDGDATVVKPFTVDPPLDTDGDGVPDDDDNCPSEGTGTNTDTDGDGCIDFAEGTAWASLTDDQRTRTTACFSGYFDGNTDGNCPTWYDSDGCKNTKVCIGVCDWRVGPNTYSDATGGDPAEGGAGQDDVRAMASSDHRCGGHKPSKWNPEDCEFSSGNTSVGLFGGSGVQCSAAIQSKNWDER